MAPLLPDLVSDILLSLPVKSLQRFRCLSKSICTEIDSPDFVKTHLKRSIERGTHLKLIIRKRESPTHFSAVDFDDGLHGQEPITLCHPLRFPNLLTSIFSVCHGLILLGLAITIEGRPHPKPVFALWNPFTRKYKKIPACPARFLPGNTGLELCSAGLGYDDAVDDYKIVLLWNVFKPNFRGKSTQVWVFKLRSNCWRRIEDLSPDYRINSFAVSINGFQCWSSSGWDSEKMIGFDLVKEVFFNWPNLCLSDGGPEEFSFDGLHFVEGGRYIYASKLCSGPSNCDFYLFVCNKDATIAEGYWKKAFTFENCCKYRPWLLTYPKDSVLIHHPDGIFWYNIEKKTREMVEIPGLPEYYGCDTIVCGESLVSPGSNSVFDDTWESQRGKERNRCICLNCNKP